MKFPPTSRDKFCHEDQVVNIEIHMPEPDWRGLLAGMTP
jgi:hypothetical protein